MPVSRKRKPKAKTKAKTKSYTSNIEMKFWEWFKGNADRFYTELDTNPQPIFNELNKRLQRIHTSLTFLFGPIDNGKREFIISADGDRSAFSNVIRLVEIAPKIDGWEVIAFRPRQEDMCITIGEYILDSDNIFFTYNPEGDRISLNLYIKDYKKIKEFDQGVFLLLDSVLGEYDVETKIGYIEFNRLGEEPPDTKLLPLKDLPQIVDSKFSQK